MEPGGEVTVTLEASLEPVFGSFVLVSDLRHCHVMCQACERKNYQARMIYLTAAQTELAISPELPACPFACDRHRFIGVASSGSKRPTSFVLMYPK